MLFLNIECIISELSRTCLGNILCYSWPLTTTSPKYNLRELAAIECFAKFSTE